MSQHFRLVPRDTLHGQSQSSSQPVGDRPFRAAFKILAVLLVVLPGIASAELPAPFDLGKLQSRCSTGSQQATAFTTRTRIGLAGTWLVQPVFPAATQGTATAVPDPASLPASAPPRPEHWLLADLPGNWRTGLSWPDGKPLQDAAASRPAKTGSLWSVKRRPRWPAWWPVKELGDDPLAKCTAAWLVHEVRLPPREPGQKVLLYLDAVWGGIQTGPDGTTLAPSHVYVNGRHAGTITAWQRKRFDVTASVRDDRMQVAILNGSPALAGQPAIAKIGENALPAGIFKTPFVEITRPTPLVVDEVLITPSVRTKTLKAAIKILADDDCKVDFRAHLYEVPMLEARKLWPPAKVRDTTPDQWRLDSATLARAQPLASLSADRTVTARKGATEVTVTFPSGDLECWSPAEPRLYWISLEARDPRAAVLDVSVPVTFGFREVWVDGPDILLNGMKINLYGTSHNYYGDYIWTPEDLAGKHFLGLTMDRTHSTWWRAYEFADDAPVLADRWGHFFSTNPRPVPEVMHRYLHNHPSLLMWQFDGNGFVNGPHSHPAQIGEPQIVPPADDPRYEQYLAVRKAWEDMKRIDPSRPVYFYRLGWGGDVRSLMGYLDVNESTMDMMEWFWGHYQNARQRKIEPFVGAEISLVRALPGMFYWSAPAEWTIGRLGHVEHAARLFGDDAYALVTPEEMVPEAYVNPSAHLANHAPSSKLMTRLHTHLYDHVLCAWRSCGAGALFHIDGKPTVHFEDYAQGVLTERSKAFHRAMAPCMAYIAGPGEDFNAMDHAFGSGETVRKQVLLFNDTFAARPVNMEVAVRATLDGKEIFAKRVTVPVENGRRGSVPVEFPAPEVAARSTGTIEAKVTADGQPLEVRPLAFHVFGRTSAASPGSGQIALIDPVGDTARMLDLAGIRYRKIGPEQSLDGASLLVIGRNAYAHGLAQKLDAGRLAEHLGRGGSVIVFEQDSRHVAGLTNEHFNIRQAFIRDPCHPLFQGLVHEDFSFWRGQSDILEPYQHFSRAQSDWLAGGRWAKHGIPNRWGQQRRFVPQWSNRNMLATFCYQKPQAGNFRVLLDCGFDNLFTPLVEMQSQGGRILFCQLDVTNRYRADPVITRLVDRMLAHYARPLRPDGHASGKPVLVAVVGDAETRRLVQRLGFQLAPSGETPQAGSHVALVQPGAASEADAAQLLAFVRRGGRCVILGAFNESDLTPLQKAGLLPVACGEGTTDRIALNNPPTWMAGLGASDFFYRRFMPGILAQPGGSGWTGAAGLIHIASIGSGQVAYLAVRPEVFEVEWRPDRPAWQETEVYWPTTKFYRILATLLTSGGATSDVVVDLTSTKRSGAIYLHRALDFDPMQSYTW